MKKQWEYLVVNFPLRGILDRQPDNSINDHLDKFGQQGWELVEIEGIQFPEATKHFVAFFKREIESGNGI